VIELVVYREFSDGDEEIGVLTYESGHLWVHVGDFDYCLTWPNVFTYIQPFIVIGVL